MNKESSNNDCKQMSIKSEMQINRLEKYSLEIKTKNLRYKRVTEINTIYLFYKTPRTPIPVESHEEGPSLLLLHGLFPSSVLEQLRVHLVCGQLHVPHHRASDEAVFHRQHVRIFLWICDTDICELYVQILVH